MSAPVLIPEQVRKAFTDAWFKEKTYDGQEGVFLARTLKVGDIADFLDSSCPSWGESAEELDDVIVEICPDGSLQYCLDCLDELFGRFHLPADAQNWASLARACGVQITEQHLRNLSC